MMQSSFTMHVETEKSDYALLVLEPLEQGYGHTLGNALRRTLMTSIAGTAVTEVRVEGIKHMFSNLPGMREDIVDFILQLKQLRVRYQGEEPIELTLEVSGPKDVTAAEFEVPSGVEIVNPDLVLAHLADSKAKLKAVVKVEKGYGYRSSEENKTTGVGVMPLDASFSPVQRVRFTVRETRVGQRTDFDKLMLEVWTDGTMAPSEAVKQAAQTLVTYLDQVVNPKAPAEEQEEKVSPQDQEVMKLTVEELDLPTRIANALRKGGYKTVKDLSEATRDEIAKVKNLGGKSVDVVIEKIMAKGVGLKD